MNPAATLMDDDRAPRHVPIAGSCFDNAREHFLGIIQTGRDAGVRNAYMPGQRYPVSEYLSESTNKATQALLFKACHEALCGRHNTASVLLREFAGLVADDYAEDNSHIYEGTDQ